MCWAYFVDVGLTLPLPLIVCANSPCVPWYGSCYLSLYPHNPLSLTYHIPSGLRPRSAKNYCNLSRSTAFVKIQATFSLVPIYCRSISSTNIPYIQVDDIYQELLFTFLSLGNGCICCLPSWHASHTLSRFFGVIVANHAQVLLFALIKVYRGLCGQPSCVVPQMLYHILNLETTLIKGCVWGWNYKSEINNKQITCQFSQIGSCPIGFVFCTLAQN